MYRTVLLRHETPDGSFHYDWMIQRPGNGGLATFRVRERIDSGEVRGFAAERLADHRVEYLTFEGEISGGRGRVSRVAEGELATMADGPAEFRAVGRLGDAGGAFEGRPGAEGRWEFVFRREQ